MGDPQSFAISFNAPTRALVTPLGGRHAHVVVDDEDLTVHYGAVFRATVPRSSVTSASPRTGRVTGYGAHGWRGTWLVNGSGRGLVALEIEPPARGWVAGFPVQLRELRLSVEDPDGFLAAVGPEA